VKSKKNQGNSGGIVCLKATVRKRLQKIGDTQSKLFMGGERGIKIVGMGWGIKKRGAPLTQKRRENNSPKRMRRTKLGGDFFLLPQTHDGIAKVEPAKSTGADIQKFE